MPLFYFKRSTVILSESLETTMESPPFLAIGYRRALNLAQVSV